MGRGFRAVSFMSELNKSFHDRTSLRIEHLCNITRKAQSSLVLNSPVFMFVYIHLSLLYYDKRLFHFHFFFTSDYCPRLSNCNFLCVICIQADLLCYFLLNEKAVRFKSVQWSFHPIHFHSQNF